MQPKKLLDFWFSEAVRPFWFQSTANFDADLKERFEPAWLQAAKGEYADWQATADGALALVILLDQMPLNMYRNQAKAFSTEALSRVVASCAIEQGLDQQLPQDRRGFLYIPFMHSENLSDQNRAVALFDAAGLSNNLRFAKHHREIIRRFQRFPHRNAILKRDSTAAEIAWLSSSEGFNP